MKEENNQKKINAHILFKFYIWLLLTRLEVDLISPPDNPVTPAQPGTGDAQRGFQLNFRQLPCNS